MKERFPAEALTRNQSNASASDRPIFIVGMIRSGTTLVEQILSSHPEVAAGGEQKFWVSEAPRFVARPAEALKELSDRYLQLLSASQNGKPRVTDKEPMNYLWLGLIHQAFPHPRIVHVMREPVDNALSIYMTEFEKPPSFAHDRRHIVDAYRQYQQIMEHWRAVIPEDRLLEIRYEDIVEDLEGSAKRMLDHCGLTWSPACLNFHRREGRVATPSVWQVRQPIYRGSVQKWRNYEPWLEEFAELLT